MDSILTSIKKMLGIIETYEHFDDVLIVNINSALFALYQIGVGEEPFTVSGNTEEWTDLLEEIDKVPAIKDFVFLKVKMAFDPPTASNAMQAANSLLDEYAYRINAALDSL